MKVHFDGGRRSDHDSCGVALYIAFEQDDTNIPKWIKYTTLSKPLGDVTVNQAELRGAYEAASMALDLVQRWYGRTF